MKCVTRVTDASVTPPYTGPHANPPAGVYDVYTQEHRSRSA